jgi:hypothetical protein
MPHSHKIPKNSVLTERHDPITGDAFVVGDKVVFCTSCHSAFLADSWKYIGGLHCGQSRTLKKIPDLEEINLRRGIDEAAQKSVKDDTFLFKMEKVSERFYAPSILPYESEVQLTGFVLAFITGFLSLLFIPDVLKDVFSTYGFLEALGITFLIFLIYPFISFAYNFFYIRPKKVRNPNKKPRNVGFHLGEYFLYLIKPDPQKHFLFFKKPEYETYRYTDLAHISLRYTRQSNLQLTSKTKEGAVLRSTARLLKKKEVPFYLRTGLIEISRFVPVQYSPLNHKDRTVMQNLMEIHKHNIRLR